MSFHPQSCRGCGSPTEATTAPPFDVELHDMDITRILREESDHMTTVTADTAFSDSPQPSKAAPRDAQQNAAPAGGQKTALEEAEVTSSSVEVKQD